MSVTKQQLLKLVADNKLSVLAEQLALAIDEQDQPMLKEELAQINGQLAQFEQNNQEGIYTTEQAAAELARIRKRYILLTRKTYKKSSNSLGNTRKKRWFWVAGIIIFCALLIGLGTFRWPTIDFVLEAKTPYLSFLLDKNWDLEQDIYLETFSSFTVKSVQMDGFDLKIEEGEELEEVFLGSEEGQIKWQEMDLLAGTQLNLEIQDDQLYSQVYNDSLRCVFALRNTLVEIPNQDLEFSAGSDSTLVLAELILAEGPQFSFAPTEDSTFTFDLMPVSGLDFQRTNLEDDRNLKSEIVDGSITIRNITTSLKENRYIDLIQPGGTTLSMYHKDDYLYVRVKGSAKDITIGNRPDNQSSVKPTIVEHLSQNANANLIWSWIVGLLGVLGLVVELIKRRS